MKLHLGSGGHILKGWENLDTINHPEVVYTDLSKPLKYAEGSVDLIYSEHFIEHLTEEEGLTLFKESYRVLKSKGGFRVSCPNLRTLAFGYLTGDKSDLKKKNESLGLYFDSPCQMFNNAMRWWGHKYLYDEDEMIRKLEMVGFKEIKEVKWKESEISEFKDIEGRPFINEIIFEATKLL